MSKVPHIPFINPSGTKRGEGIENDPHQGFSSEIFARGMISKQNFG